MTRPIWISGQTKKLIVSVLSPSFSKRSLSMSRGAKRIMQISFSDERFLPQRRSGAANELSRSALRCAAAPLREKSSSVNLPQNDIKRTDNRDHVRNEVPDAHLPQRL